MNMTNANTPTRLTQSDLESIIERALEEARARGASQAEAAVSQDTGLSVGVRLGEVETLEHQRDRSMGITVYFGKRKGSASTADLSPVKPPYGPDESSNPFDPTGTFPSAPSRQVALTFASLPLSFMGHDIKAMTQADQNATADLADVQKDIATIAVTNPSVNWGWYQQGFGPEPFDGQAINGENGGAFHFNSATQSFSRGGSSYE